ncbi:MAG: mechanosensitive ion channel family protein [Deltaproteobacteria bacterium]|nr:mechanosensitive ion channel family protein [Deltaproteobacteria bacterium]
MKPFLVPALVALAVTAALCVVRTVAIRLFHRWAEKTETRADDILLASLRTPSLYWCLAIGIYSGVAVSDLPDRHLSYISKAVQVLLILSVTIAATNLAGRFFGEYIRKTDLPVPATGLAQGIVKGSILVVGFLLVLSAAGISITPILTALGVGGLAVALALQDTLANLFAGIYILAEKSIRVGDFVRLETGQEGYVDDITWRSTRIRMLSNYLVVIPNHKLTQSVLTNFSLPEKKMSLLIPVSVSYSADPDEVERILGEVAAKAVGEVSGLLGEPAPFVRFIPGFGAYSLDFTLICQVGEFVDQYLVQHELRKRILRRLRDEGIEIPFPQRTVHIKSENGRAE